MLYASRHGKHYAQGDDGFEEAWSANMRDAVDEAVKRAREWHERRMAIDPEYRERQQVFADEYDRLFALI